VKTAMRAALALLLVATATGLPAEAPAAGGDEAAGEQAAQAEAPTARALYVPPRLGKPRERVGGGVRSLQETGPELYALVPDHAGQTVSAEPSLFWVLGRELPAGASLVFTLIDEEQVDPLVEAELPAPQAPGIQRIDLARHGVGLELGRDYEWSVALVRDAERRSNDVTAVGWIDRVEPPAGLGASPDARGYAAHGLWYDALAAAEDPALRDELLREVGLERAGPR